MKKEKKEESFSHRVKERRIDADQENNAHLSLSVGEDKGPIVRVEHDGDIEPLPMHWDKVKQSLPDVTTIQRIVESLELPEPTPSGFGMESLKKQAGIPPKQELTLVKNAELQQKTEEALMRLRKDYATRVMDKEKRVKLFHSILNKALKGEIGLSEIEGKLRQHGFDAVERDLYLHNWVNTVKRE